MALELNLTKNTNDAIQGTLGKYYARVEYKGTMGLRELASHMHHHNTAFSKERTLGQVCPPVGTAVAIILYPIISSRLQNTKHFLNDQEKSGNLPTSA